MVIKENMLEIEEEIGDCYQVNANVLLDRALGHGIGSLKNVKLVHGIVYKDRHGHCWIEEGDFCYDYSNGNEIIMPTVLYYRLGSIKLSECYKYTIQQARKFLLGTGHFGPWEGLDEIRF